MEDIFTQLKQGEISPLFGSHLAEKVLLTQMHADFLKSQIHDTYYTIHYQGKTLIIEAPSGIYHPRESSSSQFMLRHLPPPQAGIRVLELGCGTGAIGLALAAHGASVTMVDIDPAAVSCAKHNADVNCLSVTILQSDLFSAVIDKFDLIVANLPFLHFRLLDFEERLGTDENGVLMRNFLKQAPNYLNQQGELIFTFSNLSDSHCLDEVRSILKFKCLGGDFSGEAGVWRWLLKGVVW